MAATRTAGELDSLLQRADARLARELGSFLVGEHSHRSVSVADAQGSVIASTSPHHIGNAEAVAASVTASFPSLAAGDAVVLSDPYSGSAHVQDHWLVLPFEEVGSMRAVVVVQAHLADVGGESFGNYYPYARDVWQEGVVTTPVRLAREGKLDSDVIELLKLNSRTPVLVGHDLELMHDVAGDVLGQLTAGMVSPNGAAQVALARERVRDLAAKIGEEAVAEAAVHNCAGDDARVTVELARGERNLVVDLTESSTQADHGFINSTLATTRSAIARAFIEYSAAPFSSGVLDELEIQTVAGSIVDCRPPAAVGWSPFEPAFTIMDLLRGLLSRWADSTFPQRVREPVRPPVRIDGCRREGCPF
jgi:N-methylhydantoinase B